MTPQTPQPDARTASPGEVGILPKSLFQRIVGTMPGLIVVRLLIAATILGAWQFLSGPVLSTFWVSRPMQIARLLWLWFYRGTIWPHLEATMLATSVGYVLGCLAGVLIGLALGFMPRLLRLIGPFILALYSIPKIALAPLFVILLGIGVGSKIALVTVAVFFIVLYNMLDGVRDIDAGLIESLVLMGATRGEIGVKVMIPGAMPWIFNGMRISVRYALTTAILGELIAANQGIGYLIEAASGEYDSTGVFAGVILLSAICVAITEALTRFESSTDRSRMRGNL